VNPVLRPAAPVDLADIAALFRRVQEATRPFRPELHTPAEDRAFLGNVIRNDKVWVAEADGAIVGFIGYRSGFVDHLYVDLDRQRRGTGTALLRKAMDDETMLRLWVFQENVAARRFYERHGFRLLRETDGRDNEEKEPDALLEWRRPGSA
jgi:putative acetyltransferase